MFYKNEKDDSNYNIDNFSFIKEKSPVVGGLIEKEYLRQKNNIELIASENYCSEAVLAACGSCLSWKYAEGYPYERTSGNTGRYYGGTVNVDAIEEYACDKWREVFNTDYHVNVQPHSGSQANFAAYKAVLEPGDTILAMSLDNGGHLTHGSRVSFSGKLYDVHFYEGKTIPFRPKRNYSNYKIMLRQCDVGCLTVIYNAEKIGKIYMPENCPNREDYAAWLTVMKAGVVAHRLDENLAIYSVGKETAVTTDKVKIFKSHYYVYRHYMKFNFFKSAYYICAFTFHKIFKGY